MPKAIARCEVVIEFDLERPFGDSFTVEEIHRLGKKEAEERIRNKLSEARILGTPKVLAIIVPDRE